MFRIYHRFFYKTDYLYYLIVFILVVVHFLSSVFFLDKYPLPMDDEPAFNFPALNYINGNGFIFSLHPDMPHSDIVWAVPHQFYAWFQIFTFSILEPNQFSARLPQYTASHLAILLLALFMVKYKLPLSGMFLALLWYGTRASQEVFYGRMEGLSLLCLVMGYIFLCTRFSNNKKFYATLSSLFLGLSVGFHPNTIVIAFAGSFALIIFNNPGSRLQSFYYIILGAILPIVLFISCVYPHLDAVIDQFIFASNKNREFNSFPDNLINLYDILRWSKYWLLSLASILICMTLLAIIPFIHRHNKLSILNNNYNIMWYTSVIFALSSIGYLFWGAFQPYYLVYTSVWIITSFLIYIETIGKYKLYRYLTISLCIIALSGWIPSLLWNMARYREPILYYSEMNLTPFVNRLTDIIPQDAIISISPKALLQLREFGFNFSPLQNNGKNLEVSPSNYILLTKKDYLENSLVSKPEIDKRKLLYADSIYPKSAYFNYKVYLFGPAISNQIDNT
jgi:hypothetical protein